MTFVNEYFSILINNFSIFVNSSKLFAGINHRELSLEWKKTTFKQNFPIFIKKSFMFSHECTKKVHQLTVKTSIFAMMLSFCNIDEFYIYQLKSTSISNHWIAHNRKMSTFFALVRFLMFQILLKSINIGLRRENCWRLCIYVSVHLIFCSRAGFMASLHALSLCSCRYRALQWRWRDSWVKF